jgi:hypothetical protein
MPARPAEDITGKAGIPTRYRNGKPASVLNLRPVTSLFATEQSLRPSRV